MIKRRCLHSYNESVNKVLRENVVDNGYLLDFNCRDIPELYPRLEEIVDMSYEKKGGHNTGFVPENTSLVRLFSTQITVTPETIVALAGYNSHNTIVGLRYIGGDPVFPFYKQAVEELCKAQIEYKNLNCFAEVSDAIEHYFAKNGGDVVPNLYVHKVMGRPSKLILDKEDDKVHYKREFPAQDLDSGVRRLRKVMFGFGNDDMFHKIEALIKRDFSNTDIQSYQDFKRIALAALDAQHQQFKRDHSARIMRLLKKCVYESAYTDIDSESNPVEYIIDVCRQYFGNFAELYERGVREFPKEVLEQIHDILDIYLRAENHSQTARDLVDDFNRLLTNVTELALIFQKASV